MRDSKQYGPPCYIEKTSSSAIKIGNALDRTSLKTSLTKKSMRRSIAILIEKFNEAFSKAFLKARRRNQNISFDSVNNNNIYKYL